MRYLQWRTGISEGGTLSLNGLRDQVSQLEAKLNDLRQSFLGLHSSWEVRLSKIALAQHGVVNHSMELAYPEHTCQGNLALGLCSLRSGCHERACTGTWELYMNKMTGKHVRVVLL